jgi:hypothetical protein
VSAPALAAVSAPTGLGRRQARFGNMDDTAKLEETLAECERLRKALRDRDVQATKYRIVKWSPGQPKQPAIEEVFADLAFAESVKAQLEKDMPHRCFAVEPE